MNENTDKTKEQLLAELEELRESSKKREAAIKENADRLSTAMRATNDGIWDWDLKANTVFFDTRYYQMAGYDVDEFPHRLEEFQKRVHPDDIDFVMDQAQKYLRGEIERFVVEFRFKKKTGDWLWVRGRGSIVERDENKEPLRFIGIHTDITERKQVEELLRESELRLKSLINATPDIICFKDGKGRWLIANDADLDLFSLQNVDYLGKTDAELAEFTNPLYKEAFLVCMESDERSWQSKGLSRGEEVIPTIDGTNKTYEVIKVPLFESDGARKGLVVLGRDITERKLAEEDLKASEKKCHELSTLLRLMADNLPDMLWAKNLNNEYIFVNKAMCTGLLNAKDTDEPLGKTDMFFAVRERNAHPDNPEWHTFGELCRDSDVATREAMKPMHFDEFGTVKGEFLFLDAHKAPLYDSDGQLIGVVGSARDVTADKEAEKELLKLSTALKQSPSLVAITDTKGKAEYVNPKFTEHTGYSLEEAIGLNHSVLRAAELDDETYKELLETISSGKIWRGEFYNKNKNGELFWERATISPIFDEQGQIINYVKVAEDITRRKQAEEELAAEKERLAVTLQSIGDAVITTDIDGKIVLINKVAEDLTGWSNEDARGKFAHEVFSIVNEKTGQKCASPVSRVLEFGRIVGLANHTALITKNGAQISIADSGAPIRDAESKIVGVVLVFRDVTHERRIEAELLKTRKLESVGVLAGGIAHDFNNILVAVLGNIELASLRVEDDEVTSLLSSAQKATTRATKLTQQLLTFSKGGDPVKEKTSLSGLIQESADFVLHGSNVRCEYSSPDDLWMVDADSGQIGQVIQNIIINAMQAMPEGDKIQISCSNIENAVAEALLGIHDESFVCIRIQDTGIGIPREIIDKIFDPYYTTKQQGSGLGLAICHSIINKHDGHISVQSKPGQGTTFTIYLPAASTDETTAPKVTHTGSAGRAARIMVMDDEEIIRNLVKTQLTMLGHEAVLVADGEQAINEYQKLQDSGTPVDLVIMDLTIPGGMGGQEAAKRLLQVDPQANIIVASGYSNDPVMADFREYGFCGALAKPFNLAQLRKSIEAALG